jgi:large subunit ribosomal protein L24
MKAGVTKPTSSRNRIRDAHTSIRRKFLSAPLSPNLRAEHGARSMPVVVDDTVSIIKGDRKLAEGKVLRVDTKNSKIYIEGVTRSRMDGSTVQIPIKPQNVMIIRLNLNDQWRRRILERKSFSAEEE